VTAPAREKATAVAVVKEALARIAVIYRVPAYLGAPVEFEGTPGRVVGGDPVSERVLVRLAGEPRPDLFHPRWHLIWLEENGPATAVPRFPVRTAPALLTWVDGEGQWSGI
jgi:hypothetical protein